MSSITKVEIALGRVVNLGNYESFRAKISIVEEFEEGEFSDEKYEELRKLVYCKLQAQVARILP